MKSDELTDSEIGKLLTAMFGEMYADTLTARIAKYRRDLWEYDRAFQAALDNYDETRKRFNASLQQRD